MRQPTEALWTVWLLTPSSRIVEDLIVEHIFPKLPYAQDAFPICRVPIGGHHQAGTRGAIFNNAAQDWTHACFWQSMKPDGGGSPTGALGEAIAQAWGSVDKFRKLFLALAVGHFGSGWTWLVKKGWRRVRLRSSAGSGERGAAATRPLLSPAGDRTSGRRAGLQESRLAGMNRGSRHPRWCAP